MQILKDREIKCVNASGDNNSISVWRKIEKGEFSIVFTTPESLLSPVGYFIRHIQRNRKSQFYSRLIGVVLDECHCVKTWGGFRPEYRMLGTLRECFPKAVFAGFTASMTPPDIVSFKKYSKMRNSVVIKRSVRRYNLKIWVARIQGKEYEDLRILIPDNLTSADKIPQTLIFVHGRMEANEIGQWLRTLFPVQLRDRGYDIIRAFSAPLDEASKTATLELLRKEECRIAVCTDAFGLGMNIPKIPRVVQWKVNCTLGIDQVYQRIRRAGRDTDEPALALIFVSNESLELPETSQKPKKGRPPKKPSTAQLNHAISDLNINEQNDARNPPAEFSFSLAATKENWPLIQKVLPGIYAGPPERTAAKKQKPSETRLVASVKWTVCTNGCRHRPALIAFDDENKFFDDPNDDCDQCHNARLVGNSALHTLPVLHGNHR